jgi:hypothetical protein
MNDEFRRIHMPYCLRKMNDAVGGWIVLNRYYKPLGQSPRIWVDYEEIAADRRIRRIVYSQMKSLSHDAIQAESGMIFLYDDGCIPTRNKTFWNDYQKRLAVLAGMTTKGDMQVV